MKKYSLIAVFMLAVAALCSCDDSKSYAELLNEEDMYVNNYLADQNVIMDIPEDSVFVYGPDAPFYRIDPDGLLYMRVIRPGTEGNMVEDNEQIYFRFTRYALAAYSDGKLPEGQGNNISLSPYWFRYNNYSIQASVTWGVGVQRPLAFLPVDCEVDLVVKSQMGLSDEESYVQPYLFRLTYDRRQ